MSYSADIYFLFDKETHTIHKKQNKTVPADNYEFTVIHSSFINLEVTHQTAYKLFIKVLSDELTIPTRGD